MKIAVFASILLHAAFIWLAPAVREQITTGERPPGVFYIGEFQALPSQARERPEPDGAPRLSHSLFPETATSFSEPPAFSPAKVREPPLPGISAVKETGFLEIPAGRIDLLGESLSGYEPAGIPFEERINP